MGRILIFIYGVTSYAIGLGGLVCFILFIGGWSFLPFHINSSSPGPIASALTINLGLIFLFGLQHSIMARAGFKRALAKIIPQAAERSTYVLVSGVLMVLFCLYWQPISGGLWALDSGIGNVLLTSGYVIGWTLVVLSSFLINHFELFGLQQVYHNFVNKPVPSPYFTDRFLYKVVRHPLQLGVLIGLWSTPVMSMTHLMLASSMTVYIFIGLYFEEKDLAANLGNDYQEYKKRVPMIVPFSK